MTSSKSSFVSSFETDIYGQQQQLARFQHQLEASSHRSSTPIQLHRDIISVTNASTPVSQTSSRRLTSASINAAAADAMVAVTAGAAAVTSIGAVVSQVPSRNELMDYQLLQRELAMEREKNRRMHELVEADRATIDALSARMIAAEEALQKSEVKRAELLKEYCFISEKYRFLHSAVFSRSESSEGHNGSKQVHNTTAQTATSSASTWTPRHDGSRNVNDPTATPTADRSGRRQRNLSELAAAFPSPRSDRADEGATPPTEYLTAAQTPPPQAVRHSTPIAIPDLQTASIQHSRHHLYQQSPSHHHQQQQQQDQQDQHHQQGLYPKLPINDSDLIQMPIPSDYGGNSRMSSLRYSKLQQQYQQQQQQQQQQLQQQPQPEHLWVDTQMQQSRTMHPTNHHRYSTIPNTTAQMPDIPPYDPSVAAVEAVAGDFGISTSNSKRNSGIITLRRRQRPHSQGADINFTHFGQLYHQHQQQQQQHQQQQQQQQRQHPQRELPQVGRSSSADSGREQMQNYRRGSNTNAHRPMYDSSIPGTQRIDSPATAQRKRDYLKSLAATAAAGLFSTVTRKIAATANALHAHATTTAVEAQMMYPPLQPPDYRADNIDNINNINDAQQSFPDQSINFPEATITFDGRGAEPSGEGSGKAGMAGSGVSRPVVYLQSRFRRMVILFFFGIALYSTAKSFVGTTAVLSILLWWLHPSV